MVLVGDKWLAIICSGLRFLLSVLYTNFSFNVSVNISRSHEFQAYEVFDEI